MYLTVNPLANYSCWYSYFFGWELRRDTQMMGTLIHVQNQTDLWRALFFFQGWFCSGDIERICCWSFQGACLCQIYADLILKLTGTSITDTNRKCHKRVIPSAIILTEMISSLVLIPHSLKLITSNSWSINMLFCEIILVPSSYWGSSFVLCIKITLANVGIRLIPWTLIALETGSVRKSDWSISIEKLSTFEFVPCFISYWTDCWQSRYISQRGENDIVAL